MARRMINVMMISTNQRVWVRRLTLGVVLITCVGGGAFVLVSRPHGDCVVVGDMMRTYSDFQAANPPTVQTEIDAQQQVATAHAEAATADVLHRQARDISRTELRTAADTFADVVASSAQAQLDAAEQLPELDPFDAVLPALAPEELTAGRSLVGATHVLLVACPSVPRPVGLD